MPKRFTHKRVKRSRRKTRTQRGGGILNSIKGMFRRKPVTPAPIIHPRTSYRGLSHTQQPYSTALTEMYEKEKQSWIKFHGELSTYPIFIINCHSALCINYNMCVGSGGWYVRQPNHNTYTYGSVGIPSFTVEPDTYIWSIADAGENCYNSIYLDRAISNNIETFRKALTVTSLQDDIKKHPDTPHALIGTSKRATNCEYPNISCMFVEEKEALEVRNGVNSLGVFNIKNPGLEFNNTLSDIGNEKGYCILNDTHAGPYSNKVWFLSDIIEYVYSRIYPSPRWVFSKPKRKGIFILAGCVGPIRSYDAALKRNSSVTLESHMRYVDGAEVLIRNNNLEYSSKKPTQDVKKINTYPGFEDFKIIDAQLLIEPTVPHPNVIAGVDSASSAIQTLAGLPPAASSVPHAGSHIEDDDD